MPAPRKRRSRLRRLSGYAFGLVAVLLLAGVAGAMLLLTPARLTPLVQAQLSRLAGPDLVTTLSGVSLDINRKGLISAVISGASLTSAKTGVALMDNADLEFSLSLAPLLSRQIRFSSITVRGGQFTLPVQDNSMDGGRFTGPDSLIDPKAVAAQVEAVRQLLVARLNANPDIAIRVENAAFAAGNTAIGIDSLDLAPLGTGVFRFAADIRLKDTTYDAPLRLSGLIGHTDNDQRFEARIDGLQFNRAFAPDPRTGEARACDGEASLVLARAPARLAFDLTVPRAACQFGTLGTYDMTFAASGGVPDTTGIMEIAKGRIEVNRSYFQFEGAIAPERLVPDVTGAPAQAAYRYELVVNDAVMDSVDNSEGPMALTGRIAGSFNPSQQRLSMDELVTDTGQGVVTGAISLLFTGTTPALYLALDAPEISVANFKRLWPRFAAPAPRKWVSEKVFGGTARNVRLEIALPPGKLGSRTPLEQDQMKGQADLFGVRFDTVGDIPPVRGADATVRFDGKAVDVRVVKGVAFLNSDRSAEIKSAAFTIDDLRQRPVKAQLAVEVAGDADAIAEIASTSPINALAALELAPEDFSGGASASGTIDFALPRQGEKLGPVGYDITLNVSGLSLARPVRGQTISNATGVLEVTPAQLTVDLEASLNGIPARLQLVEPRNGTGERKQEVTFSLNDQQRDAVAPGLKGIVRGVVTARLVPSAETARLEVDLSRARLRIAPLNWEKGSNIAMTATMTVRRDGQRISLSDIAFSGDALRGTGKVEIDGARLVSADLSNLRLNSGDDFSARIRAGGKGYAVQLGGQRLDARAVLRRLLPGGQGAGGSNPAAGVTVEGTVGRLVGFNDEVLADAAIRLSGGSVAVSGTFESGGALRVSRTGGEGGTLALTTGNAGAALRFADLYRRMVGGNLSAEFANTGGGAMAGRASIADFTVVGEPRLARLVGDQAKGSASLAEATGAEFNTSRAQFDLAQGQFSVSPGGIVVSDGVARGRDVGATVEGTVINADGRMDLRGTFMPARGLNRIVGAIPFLGALMGSGNRAGLIGVTYQLVGEARNPQVFINPLSLITPGVFRQIFE